jgi:hypothetical protein
MPEEGLRSVPDGEGAKTEGSTKVENKDDKASSPSYPMNPKMENKKVTKVMKSRKKKLRCKLKPSRSFTRRGSSFSSITLQARRIH